MYSLFTTPCSCTSGSGCVTPVLIHAFQSKQWRDFPQLHVLFPPLYMPDRTLVTDGFGRLLHGDCKIENCDLLHKHCSEITQTFLYSITFLSNFSQRCPVRLGLTVNLQHLFLITSVCCFLLESGVEGCCKKKNYFFLCFLCLLFLRTPSLAL